ncbi:unnamed protein product [Lactuca saligna]|uniref:Uncharacterized protein n=1 Tax=Lactuca saligna TaxID=75948 RepID=A0AA35V5G1_LACSI|nr:unnamed protein product [Lactuca saligna]
MLSRVMKGMSGNAKIQAFETIPRQVHCKSWCKKTRILFKILLERTPEDRDQRLTADILREAAAKTDGFSGREVAKLMASVQAVVYGSENCVLDPLLFREVVDYKVVEHQQRRKLAGNDGGD